MSHAGTTWRATAAELFSGSKPAFATTLVAVVLKAYGAEALNWDPLTLRVQLEQDFGVPLGRVPYNKIMALIAALTTDQVYFDPRVFDHFVHCIKGTPASTFDEIPTADDVTWAVIELAMADPEGPYSGKGTPWGPSIRGYVGAILDHEGITGEPQGLEWATRKNIPQASTQDPEFFNAATGSTAAKATEIDAEISNRVTTLVHQLGDLGIEPGELH